MFGTAKEREQRLKELAGSKGVHRLIDMLVKENSIVDRGANGRRYLLVKQALEEITMKFKLPKAVKAEVIKIFEGIAQRLTVVQERVKAAKVVKDAPLSPELGAWVRGATQGLTGAVEKYPSKAIKEVKLELGDEVKFDDIEKKEFELSADVQKELGEGLGKHQETVAGLLTKFQEAEETDDKMETPLPDDVAKTIQELATGLKEMHDKHSKPAEKKKEDEKVDKAGRPLSQDKVKTLAAAAAMLDKLLQAVTGDSKKSLPLGQTQDLISNTDPNQPNAGSGLQPSAADTMTALEAFKDVPGMAAVMKLVKEKIASGGGKESSELKKMLEKAQSDLKTTQETVKSQETTIEKQAQKLKEVPSGNAGEEVEIEKGEDDTETTSVWDTDMAKPGDRESVEKRGEIFIGPDKD